MNFCDIKPYVRHAEKICIDDSNKSEFVASYDHIILYTLSGNATIYIDKQIYNLTRGTILIIKPGSFYAFSDESKSEIISIHFDWSNENSIERGFYLEPVSKEKFNPRKICETFTIDDEECFNVELFSEELTNMEETFKLILSEFNRAKKYFDFRVSCYLISVLIEISRRTKNIKTIVCTNDDTGRAVLEYIHQNISQNISVENLSEQFKFHSTYINILVKKLTGYPIHKYIMVRRISKAIELLQYSDMRISEIAEKVGFPDASHFSKVFKQHMGKSPREFRKNE